MIKQKRSIIGSLLVIAALFQVSLFFSSCGFAYQKHVTGNYYIIGVDDKNQLSLNYSTGFEGFAGKAPGVIREFGYNDTFLVAKTIEYNQASPFYYIIDMNKDSDVALEETFRIGPLSEEQYNKTWAQKLNIKLKQVEWFMKLPSWSSLPEEPAK